MNTFRLLLIDTEHKADNALGPMLTQLNTDLVAFSSVDNLPDGLNILKKTKVDVVILGLSSSNDDKLDTLIQLTTEIPTIPIVGLVTPDDEVIGIKALQNGAKDYLIRDQFDHKLLMRVLRQSIKLSRLEEQLIIQRNLFRNFRTALITTDQDAVVIDWNPYAERLYQWSPDEIIGQSLQKILTPVDQLVSLKDLIGLLEVIGSWEGEFIIQDRNGVSHPAYCSVTSFPDSQSHIKGYMVTATDLTDRKQNESEQVNYRQHLEQIVEKRTKELIATNNSLQMEIVRREQIESELRFRMDFEKLITTISTTFIDLEPAETDQEVSRALRKLGEFAEIDRAYLVLLTDDYTNPIATYSWSVPGIMPEKTSVQSTAIPVLIAWIEKLKALGTIQATKQATIPTEVGLHDAFLRSRNFLSLIATAIVYRGEVTGFLSFETIREEKAWLSDTSLLLNMAGQIFVNAVEHQRTHAELIKSEERLRNLTDNMLDIVYQTDPNGVIEYVSPSCLSLLGYPPEKLLGQSIYSWLDPTDLEHAKEAIQTVGSLEYRYKRADGHYLWLETLSNTLYNDDGTFKGYIFASHDVTARKQAEQDLQELNLLKTEFLSTAAHELRTPLASVLGFSEIILTRDLPPDRIRHFTKIINDQSVQLRKLVDSLLDVSELESSRGLRLDLQIVNLSDLIASVLIPFIELFPKHRFEIDGFELCPPVFGDPSRLSQVVQNLLSNAVRYAPSGGSVMIYGQLMYDFIHITVQDHGIGMMPEQQKHLFERFYRADSSNTTMSGTGLGLTISKLIVELHYGQIWAESEYGVGTTVHFTLPIMNAPQI